MIYLKTEKFVSGDMEDLWSKTVLVPTDLLVNADQSLAGLGVIKSIPGDLLTNLLLEVHIVRHAQTHRDMAPTSSETGNRSWL